MTRPAASWRTRPRPLWSGWSAAAGCFRPGRNVSGRPAVRWKWTKEKRGPKDVRPSDLFAYGDQLASMLGSQVTSGGNTAQSAVTIQMMIMNGITPL